jgi:hypothetical protein
MNDIEDMLDTWCSSASVMHIAHHLAAARYARYQRWFGSLTAALSAIVSTSLFIAVQESSNHYIIIFSGIISILAAVFSGINSFLNLNGRAEKHYNAAISFQNLRRQIEEELVWCRKGRERENYEDIRGNWTKALNSAGPLPQDLHDQAKSEIDGRYKE